MKSAWWLSAMLVFTLADQTTEQWFATGQPELLASAEGLTPLMTWSDYAALTKNLTGPRQVVLAERPALSERARFAVNFVLGGKNRALAVDGGDDLGYRFYADTNGDGRLTDDEMLPMISVPSSRGCGAEMTSNRNSSWPMRKMSPDSSGSSLAIFKKTPLRLCRSRMVTPFGPTASSACRGER